MAIFYMKVNIVGRSSGRSAIGAAAYRRSAKMQSVAHAAYQRGEKIYAKGDKIIHDYRSKGGVVHSEIMLPDDAPPEFMDSETLWNAVEASEKRKDAQLAREIIVALPREFDLEEHVEVLRAYLQENFVKMGMVADFSIHDNDSANPHAHIMLTTRHVSRKGFGKKNTDWNKKELLLEWRKAWANTNNDMFERKGLAERLDHRSYKEQGIDRLPYIHLGHEAAALEKKGIRTRRGDYNREIERRNSIRANLNPPAVGVASGVRNQTPESAQSHAVKLNSPAVGVATGVRNQTPESAQSHAVKLNSPAVGAASGVRNQMPESAQSHAVNETRAALMNANYKMRQEPPEQQEYKSIAVLGNERCFLKADCDRDERAIINLEFRSENADERVKGVDKLQDEGAKLVAQRQKMHFWQFIRKGDIDWEIRKIEHRIRAAQRSFEIEHNVAYDEAPAEIERIKKELGLKMSGLEKKKARILEINQIFDDLDKRARTRTRPIDPPVDPALVQKLLAEMGYLPKKQDRDMPPQLHKELSIDALQKNAVILENMVLDIVEDLHRMKMRKKQKKITRPR